MKKAVLCVSRTGLMSQFNATETGLHTIDFNKISVEDLHYINRSVCDSKDQAVIDAIASKLPQVLPYVSINTRDGKFLTYSRSKGAESRLHGTLSLGFGGHCDLSDYSVDESITWAMLEGFDREMQEELAYDSSALTEANFTTAIVDMTNPVGSVHLGLYTAIVVANESAVTPNPDEIASPEWVDLAWLKTNIHRFESWSQMIIKDYL